MLITKFLSVGSAMPGYVAPAESSNSFLSLFGLALLALVFFLPTMIAVYRREGIWVVLWFFSINLLFGWTVFGWVFLMYWLFGRDEEET